MVMQGVRKNQGEDDSVMCFPSHAGIESCRLIAESINKPIHHKSRERLRPFGDLVHGGGFKVYLAKYFFAIEEHKDGMMRGVYLSLKERGLI